MAKAIINGQEIFGNVHIGGGSGHTYSTTEQVVGTWVDGRPLYQKSYVTNMQSGSQTCDIAFTDITGLDSVINLEGLFAGQVPFDLSGCCYGTDYSKINVTALSQYKEYGYVDSSGIRVYRQSTGTYSPTPEVVVTIRYTKSTDNA